MKEEKRATNLRKQCRFLNVSERFCKCFKEGCLKGIKDKHNV